METMVLDIEQGDLKPDKGIQMPPHISQLPERADSINI